MKKILLTAFTTLAALPHGLCAQAVSFESLMSNLPKPGLELPAVPEPAVPDMPLPPENKTPEIYNFNAEGFPGFYDASGDRRPHNIPQILKDIPAMWALYGELFKKVGADRKMDPYALASFCIFESYNSDKHNFNPRMKQIKRNMYAAGIAGTQAQDVRGSRIPGLDKRFPRDLSQTIKVLRANPEYGIRCLAAEFRGFYSVYNDLAMAFPKVALPAWTNPNSRRGEYGTQAQFVSRAYVFYRAFRSADGIDVPPGEGGALPKSSNFKTFHP